MLIYVFDFKHVMGHAPILSETSILHMALTGPEAMFLSQAIRSSEALPEL